MELIERNGLRILTPKLGYILHDKVSDIYSEKVYLGKYANVEDYEEVLNENFNPKLYEIIENMQNQVNTLEENNIDYLNILDEEIDK